jgi:hypothetical protein
LFLKNPEESSLSEGGLKKQKNHAQHGACFLPAGLKPREGRYRLSGIGTPAIYSGTTLFSVSCRDLVL